MPDANRKDLEVLPGNLLPDVKIVCVRLHEAVEQVIRERKGLPEKKTVPEECLRHRIYIMYPALRCILSDIQLCRRILPE